VFGLSYVICLLVVLISISLIMLAKLGTCIKSSRACYHFYVSLCLCPKLVVTMLASIVAAHHC